MRVITLARKPLVGSVADNVQKHSTGGLNIESSRVTTGESLDGGAYAKNPTPRAGKDLWSMDRKGDTNVFKRGGAGDYEHPGGRWPSNVILEHHPECRQTGTKKVKGIRVDTRPEGDAGRTDKSQWRFRPTEATRRGYSDEDGLEDIPAWECHPDCPVLALDYQSGDRPSGGSVAANPRTDSIYEDGLKENHHPLP